MVQKYRSVFVRKFLGLSVSVLGLITLTANVSYAYDNDTHFVLTYYISRAVGFTPEQAYRIASANVGVDWSTQTEPLQLSLKRLAHGPKVRKDFHAFADKSLADPIGAINATLNTRWDEAYSYQNPGVYLHAYQDVYSHNGWECVLGHSTAGTEPDYLSSQNDLINKSMIAGTIVALEKYFQPSWGFPIRLEDKDHIFDALARLTDANHFSILHPLTSPSEARARKALLPILPKYDSPIPSSHLDYEFVTNEDTQLNNPTMPCAPSKHKDRLAIWSQTTVTLQQVQNRAGITYRQAACYVSLFDPWFDNTASKGYRAYDSVALTPEQDNKVYPLFPVGSLSVRFLARGIDKTFTRLAVQPINEVKHVVDWTSFSVFATKYHTKAGQYTLTGMGAKAEIKKQFPIGHFNCLITFKQGNKNVALYFGGMNTYSNKVHCNGLDWDNFSVTRCAVEYGLGNFLTGAFEVKTDNSGKSTFSFSASGKDGKGNPISFSASGVPLPEGSIDSKAY